MAKELATTNKKALSKGKGQKMPSKRTMNFVHHQSSFNASRMIPIILLMIIVAAVFVKFGVLDFMDKKMAAYDEVGQKQQQLSDLNKALSDIYYCGGSSVIEPLRNAILKATGLTMHHIHRLIPGKVVGDQALSCALAAGAAVQKV